MSEPLISLVTSAYRADQYLEPYFQGMCAQTVFASMEVILVLNDPSAAACAIADGYSARYPEQIRILKVPRESIAASTNRGYRQGRGRYLTYADIDDAREPACYERQTATLEKAPTCDFTYGNFVVVSALGECQGQAINPPEFDRAEFTRGSYVCANHFFRRELLDRCGYWDEQFRSGGDFEFQVRAAFHCTFKKTPGPPLFYYTRAANSGSASSTALQPIERTVIELRYGIYDKIDYRYLRQARQYRIQEIALDGGWQPVERFIPHYQELLEAREPLRSIGVKYYRRAQVRRAQAKIRRGVTWLPRRLLTRLGLYERLFPGRVK